MNKRRRAYKKRSKKDQKQVLYNEVRRQVNKANQRLNTLERRVKRGTWAAKKLKTKLDTRLLKAYSKSGRIKINPNMTTSQLIAIQKATRNFLNSETSTIAGIERVKEQTIYSLYQTFDIEKSDLTINDYANIYDLFGEKEFSDLSNYIKSSDIIVLITDCIDNKWDEDTFVKNLESLRQNPDVDIRSKAISLYNKIKPLMRNNDTL